MSHGVWSRSRLAKGLPECPHCGRPLGEAGEPQARELRFKKVEAAQVAAYRRLLTWGVPTVAVIAIAMPFIHIGALAVVPLLIAVHLVIVRVVLVRDAQRLLRPMRRLLNRWLARFSFLWIGLPGYGAMTVPVVGVVLGAGTFVLLTSIVHVSTTVSLNRERVGPGSRSVGKAGSGRAGRDQHWADSAGDWCRGVLRVVGDGHHGEDAGAFRLSS